MFIYNFLFWLQLFNFTYANNCQYVEYSYQNYNITIYICSNDGIYNNNIETGIKNSIQNSIENSLVNNTYVTSVPSPQTTTTVPSPQTTTTVPSSQTTSTVQVHKVQQQF